MKFYSIGKIIDKIYSFNDNEKILLGKILASQQDYNKNLNLSEYEFKVFSQWGEDGIIQYLINKLNIENKTFVEFGVETYQESNTRFLVLNNNWSGLIIDGSKKNIDLIKQQSLYWRYSINAVQSFITAENINSILTENKIVGEIGILSVDIDGNDFWVTKAIDCIQPIILIIEYNAIFGSSRAISVPYDPQFVRNNKHSSNLYYGASLAALTHLANEKGYALVGCNSNGNNAFYVRKDKLTTIKELTVSEAFVDSKFRESRNDKGKLLFLTGNERYEYIKGLPVINVLNNEYEEL